MFSSIEATFENYINTQEMMEEEGDDEGLCFDGIEVALGCTVGLFIFS